MLENIVEDFRVRGKIFKKMQEFSPKELGIRNKISIFKTVDLHGYFWSIFVISQKTKILQKDVLKYEQINDKFVSHVQHNFKYKVIYLINTPICSKAKKRFQEMGWKIYALV